MTERPIASIRIGEPAPFHPLADIFPLLDGEPFAELVDDVRQHGVREPIWLLDGQILDGRNRHRAAVAAGVACPTRPYTGSDPLGFVVSLNLKRRHLDASQRAMVAAGLTSYRHGGKRRSDQAAPVPLVSQAQAAAMVGVSERSVRSAVATRSHGVSELIEAVEHGDLPVKTAEKLAELPQLEQRRILQQSAKARDVGHRVKVEIKKVVRDERERQLGKRQQQFPTGHCGVIYNDAARRFIPWSAATGMDRSPDNHYPTQTFEWLARLPVGDLADPEGCVIFNWSTAASLVDDLELMAEWGFTTLRPRDPYGNLLWGSDGHLLEPPKSGTYRSHQIWDKQRRGTGYWFISVHEILLVGVRGKPPAPAQGTQELSLFTELRRSHSEKPNRVVAMIERLYPSLRKVELFARGEPRPGWRTWGNQAERGALA